MLADRLLTLVVGVDGIAVAEVLDTAREELQQLGERELATGDDDASQRNALLSFSKKPSSALYVRSSACVSNSSSSRRCSSER
jgi:hypothetical protein